MARLATPAISRRQMLAGCAGIVAVGSGAVGSGCRRRTSTTEPVQPSAENFSAKLPPGPADLLITGGAIYTLDEARPKVEAVAIRNGVIRALGDRPDVRKLCGRSTETLDLKGGAATVGLTDAHGHVAGLGRSLEQVDLRGAASIEEVIARLRERARSAKGWIEGRGWDQNLWPGRQMPTHHPLTKAFPDQPVWLTRIDGHAGWGNAALLRHARINASTPSPASGEILRDPSGQPTGVLVDGAMGFVTTPGATRQDLRRWLVLAQKHLVARGLTGAHDMGIGPSVHAIYRELATSADPQQKLALRIHAYAHKSWFDRELSSLRPDKRTPGTKYALVGVKLHADGALGSLGAALLAPYSDRPGHQGLFQHSAQQLERSCDRALGTGWHAATHAIGDAANRMVLDVYERALRRHRRPDHRFRIEHCQIVTLDDIRRYGSLGIIASMQPTHATSDMPWAEARVGPTRLAGAYAWRRFADAGAKLCFGSDFPVEKADVTHGLHAATTRQNAQGKPVGGWLPDQRLSLEQALRAFSSTPAFAVGRERHLGKLAVGFQADMTCFSRDIMTVAPAELRDVPIAATVVAGRIVYRRA